MKTIERIIQEITQDCVVSIQLTDGTIEQYRNDGDDEAHVMGDALKVATDCGTRWIDCNHIAQIFI